MTSEVVEIKFGLICILSWKRVTGKMLQSKIVPKINFFIYFVRFATILSLSSLHMKSKKMVYWSIVGLLVVLYINCKGIFAGFFFKTALHLKSDISHNLVMQMF